MRRFLGGTTDTQDESTIDVTPMLDVVFIMLIFFIVTATFVKESGIEVDQPKARAATAQEHVSFLVGIDAENRIFIDRRQVDVRRVRPVLERLRAENPRGAVVIQADRDARMDTFVRVWDAARAAGIEEIAIAAKPR